MQHGWVRSGHRGFNGMACFVLLSADWSRQIRCIDGVEPTRGARPSESGVSLRFEPALALVHHPPELGARVDAELAVDAGQVRLDGLRAHESAVGNLAVR